MSYCHLTLAERREIYILQERNLGIRAIARALNRNASTISRELKRNVDADDEGVQQYNYLHADTLYLDRLHAQKGGKFQNVALTQYINSHLLQRWSPEQISGRIELDYSDGQAMRVSYSTIYRWIRLRYLEPSVELRLRRYRKRPKHKINRFPGARSVKDRCPEASTRQRIGDWELDTIVSAKRGLSGVLTMCDRKSRYCILTRMKNSKDQHRVKQTIEEVSKKLPCHTVTSDQGVEFSCYRNVEAELSIPFYVCDPHSPWQKGSVENLNGLVREFFPKGTNFREVDADKLQDTMRLLNNRPRKCLAWKTPAEILSEGCVSH